MPGKTLSDQDASPTTGIDTRESDYDMIDWQPIGPAAPVPLPSTPAELLSSCEQHLKRLFDGMRKGLPAVPTDRASCVAFLKGDRDGFVLPHLAPLWNAMAALDVGSVPSFPGEPKQGHEAVAALETVKEWCEAKTQLPTGRTGGKKLKEPSKEAIAAYRLSVATGKKQTELAKMMAKELRRPVDQPTVSRWLKAVRAWVKANNVLPELPARDGPVPKVRSMDPAKIDAGIGRRKSRDEADLDRKEQLDRLMAEQKAGDD